MLIAMWSGAIGDIPPNWSLCDGSNGTPDLSNKFVKGASGDGEVGQAAGNPSHGHGNTPTDTVNHSHTLGAVLSHEHGVQMPLEYAFNRFWTSTDDTRRRMTATGSAHGGGDVDSDSMSHAHSSLTGTLSVRHYALAFIKIDTGSLSNLELPIGAVLLTDAAEGDLPSGFSVCDGSGGTPDLRGRYVRCKGPSTSVGTSGGSGTHGHSALTASHTHTDSEPTTHTGHDHRRDTDKPNRWDEWEQMTDTFDWESHTHPLGSSGSHSHSLGNVEADLGHIKLHYVMKVA